MDVLHTMKKVSAIAAEEMSPQVVKENLRSLSTNIDDFSGNAANLAGHFPKFDEIYQMSTTPTMWADLFNIECTLIPNQILLREGIKVAERMEEEVKKIPYDPVYEKKIQLLSHIQKMAEKYASSESTDISETERTVDYQDGIMDSSGCDGYLPYEPVGRRLPVGFVKGSTMLKQTMSKKLTITSTHGNNSINFSYTNTISTKICLPSNEQRLSELKVTKLNESMQGEDQELSSLYSILSNMAMFDERLNKRCTEDRKAYNDSTYKLKHLSEVQLMKRPEFIKKGRAKVLQFMKQMSRALDIDKCTHNLAVLFFDGYVKVVMDRKKENLLMENTDPRINESYFEHISWMDDHPIPEDDMLKMGIASFMLAGALREHWVDINKDRYLDMAIEMTGNMFTTEEVIAVQLDILTYMPQGFTSMYTCMEYAMFYLANIKYINYDLNLGPNSSGDTRDHYFDDYMFLSTAFNYLVESGGLCWLYHCLSKWDDIFTTKHWNWFIPPSRCAAILVFYFFTEFFAIDPEKDLIWCRRFCHRVFKMFYDADFALWYMVFGDITTSIIGAIEDSSLRLTGMSTVFHASSRQFVMLESAIYLNYAKLVLAHYKYQPLRLVDKNRHLPLPPPTPLMLPGASILKTRKNQLTNQENGRTPSGRSVEFDLTPTIVNIPTCTARGDFCGFDYSSMSLLLSNLIRKVLRPLY